MRFGAKNEALSAEQRDLFQETWESDLAEMEARLNARPDAQVDVNAPKTKRPRAGRQLLPDHLPRVIYRHEPTSCSCAQCGNDLVNIGEDTYGPIAVATWEMARRLSCSITNLARAIAL